MSEPVETPVAQLYAVGLVQLMDRTNTHHFVVKIDELDGEASRGLSINIDVDPTDRTITFSTGRCECEKCLAAAGGTQ